MSRRPHPGSPRTQEGRRGEEAVRLRLLLLGGNVLVGVWKDSLIARVGPGGYGDALLEPHVREFDITGRPMRGWVQVGPEGVEDDGQLKGWIGRATRFVRTLPAEGE